MITNAVPTSVQHSKQPDAEYRVGKIVLAHDASRSSQEALKDAIVLARWFQAEIVLAHVYAPTDEALESLHIDRDENKQNLADLDVAVSHLEAIGLRCRMIVRAGAVGDTLFNICCDEDADLLMLGAYGFGLQDRQTLGSTAEYLLRAIPCPVLTYGPNSVSRFSLASARAPILVPIFLPCRPVQLRQAIMTAKLFGRKLVLLHVRELERMPLEPLVDRQLERECQELAAQVRVDGVQVDEALLYGKPDIAICEKSVELDSPFILMPLRWRKHLSSISSDNVAAHVIRGSTIPVMTFRID